ncbi:MAG: hypothetical protein J0H60_16405, partial [Rhizobiales bacterium]|nr:hypothetical protein [Hyphomicrobiales bacterium]
MQMPVMAKGVFIAALYGLVGILRQGAKPFTTGSALCRGQETLDPSQEPFKRRPFVSAVNAENCFDCIVFPTVSPPERSRVPHVGQEAPSSRFSTRSSADLS